MVRFVGYESLDKVVVPDDIVIGPLNPLPYIALPPPSVAGAQLAPLYTSDVPVARPVDTTVVPNN
jgi:hypothetical protein